MNHKTLTTLLALTMLLSAAGTDAFGQPDSKKGTSYWIGVVCRPPSMALREQLNLPKDSGLVVETIVPKSAADKAGLKRHDILTKAGDKVLKDTGDLRAAIAGTGGEKIALELLRGGAKKTVSIVPQERTQIRRFERRSIERKEPEKPKAPPVRPKAPKKPETPDKPVEAGYWIGIYSHPAPPELLKKIDLPEGKGLFVQNVIPDSPAAKAGIKGGDILVEAGDAPLVNLEDLIKVISKSDGKKIEVILYRSGNKKSITVQPAKKSERPGQFGNMPMPMPNPMDREKIEEWIKKMQPGDIDKNQMRLRFIHPPAMSRALPPIPDNMSVSITKNGKDPAKIVVKKGDEKWEVTEDNLEKLPPDVRPHVEKMLGGVSIRIDGADVKDLDFAPNIRMFHDRLKQGGNINPSPNIHKRMEDLEKQLKRLQKSIDEMNRRNRADRGK